MKRPPLLRYDIPTVLAATDLKALVEEYAIPLKRVGKEYSARCPFHQERTPSFQVNPEKQLFHCWGCGASGTALDFMMRIESVPIKDAIRLLAERAGVEGSEAPRLSDAERRRQADERRYAIAWVGRWSQWYTDLAVQVWTAHRDAWAWLETQQEAPTTPKHELAWWFVEHGDEVALDLEQVAVAARAMRLGEKVEAYRGLSAGTRLRFEREVREWDAAVLRMVAEIQRQQQRRAA